MVLRALKFPCLLAILSAAYINTSYAQAKDSNPLKFDVIPPSPEAASIGKFIDNPVSTYTGLPQIEIPIHTLKSYELSLPISLSYYAGGVKWEEIPSWVGANWTLNAGGIVSRTIRGRHDEDPVFGYFMTSPAANYNIPSFFSGGAFSNANFAFVSPNCNINEPSTEQYRNVLYASKGGLDLEPDQFFFSLPDGQSGKFMFSRSRQMRLIPHQFANISHVPDSITGVPFKRWVIVGKDGVKYTFQKQEITTSNTPCKELFNGTPETFTIPDVEAPSSWRLVRMENASGTDYIVFNYVAETYSYETRVSTTTYDRVSGDLGPPPTNICKNQTSVLGWRLSEIITKAGYRAVFDANTSRADLVGSKMLDRIRFYHNNTFLKRYDITYTGSPSVISKLQEFFVESGAGASIPSYNFSYFEDGGAQTPSYMRTSTSLDHWGYYNGSINSNFVSPPLIYNGVYYAGGDRNSRLIECRYMTLREIQYPTGGKVSYEYELNDFTNVPPIDNFSKLELIDAIEFNVTNTSKPTAYQTKNFSLSQNETVILFFEIPAVPGGGIPVNGLHATLTKSSGAPFTPMNFRSGDNQRQSSPLYNFTPGNYTLYGEFTDGAHALGNQSFYVRVYKLKTMSALAQANQLQGGGLRIKRIISTGDNTYTKTYSYLSTSTGLSSGLLLSFPFYSYFSDFTNGEMQGGGCVTTSSCTALVRVNAPTIPLNTSNSGFVGYSEVREYLGTESVNNGYTVYTYTNTPDNQSNSFPFVPAQSFSYKNGLPLATRVYTSAGKLVKESSNQYLYQSDAGFTIEGAKVAQLNNSGCTGCPNRVFAYRVYSEPTEKVLLQSTVNREYDLRSDSFFETSSSLLYNEFDEVREVSNSLSNEPQRKKYTRYNYHSDFKKTPTQEYSYYSNSNVNDFQFTGGIKRDLIGPNKPSNVYLLETIDAVSSAIPPSESLFKHRARLTYNTLGNVVSIEMIGDNAMTSIVWDNSGIFPIAQVMNATPSNVAYTGFEGTSNEGGWVFNISPSLVDKKTGIRSHSLAAGSLTKTGLSSSVTYILSYWAKNGIPSVGAGVVSNNDDPTADPSGWRYFEKIITGVSGIAISGSSTVLIDEVRLYPVDARMTTYSFDIVNGLMSSTDMNNNTTYFSYNPRRQLEFVKDFENNILKKNEYRYVRD